MPENTNTPPRIRPRAIILGLLLIPFIGQWIFEGEMVRYTFATWAAPFYNAVFVLFVLTLVNMASVKILRRSPLNHLELLSIYAIVSVASALMSTDMMGILITLMGFPTRFASPENQWNTLFDSNLPTWLMVRDAAALEGFYEGNSTFYRMEHIRAWLAPSLWWMLFAAALFTAFLCMSNLFRKHWVEAERLTFPIIQLPLAMTEPSGGFFTHRLMWLGFAIAAAITLMNGLHLLVPSIPEIAIKRRGFPLFDTPPWNAVSSVSISFYFFAITLGFLMPLDLSFSIWGFFFLFLGQQILASAVGYNYWADFHPPDQAFGAFMAIGAIALWGSRRHLARAWRTATGRERGYDREEPASYRLTFIALGVSLLIIAAFMYAAGMALHIAVLSILILMALAIVISRIRAELGFPVHDLHSMGPHDVLTRLIGPENIPKPTLGALSLFYWSDRVFRSHPMPHQIEGLRLAGDNGAARKDMLRALYIAGLAAIPICFVVYLTGFYKLGAATANVGPWGLGYGFETFPRLERWLIYPEQHHTGSFIALAFGALVAGGMFAIRTRVVGFPLHPLGFAVASSWGVWHLWLPIFIGSICKAIVLRMGGLNTYRKATYFFFGLMLGEFVVGCSWTLIGLAFGIRTYDFWP